MLRRRVSSRGLATAAVAMVFAGGLSACGSSGASGSGGTAGNGKAASSSVVQHAEAEVAKFEKPPSTFGITQPLKTKPTGKVLDYVQCTAPLCVAIGQTIQKAAQQVGLKVNIVSGGVQPTDITSAFDKVVQDRPNAVIDMNYPTDEWRQQLGQLHKMGTKIFLNNVPPTGNPDITGYVFNNNDASIDIKQGVYKLIADSDGKANFVYVNAPDLGPGATFQLNLWKKYTAELCPGCTLNVLNVSATAVGSTLPNTLVSWLQAHPSTTYVRAYYGDQLNGVPAALKAASLTKVKLYSGGGSAVNWQYIKNGQQTADWALLFNVYGYQLVDLVSRAVTGQKFTIPLLPTEWITPKTDNFDISANNPPYDGNYQAQFAKLWGGQ